MYEHFILHFLPSSLCSLTLVFPALPLCIHRVSSLYLVSVLGSFSEWLRQHEDLVPPVLSLLVAGLQKGKSPRLLQMAVDSIWEICNECRDHIVPYLDQLVTVCQVTSVKYMHRLESRHAACICI